MEAKTLSHRIYYSDQGTSKCGFLKCISGNNNSELDTVDVYVELENGLSYHATMKLGDFLFPDWFVLVVENTPEGSFQNVCSIYLFNFHREVS